MSMLTLNSLLLPFAVAGARDASLLAGADALLAAR
jgi:hypothetical protein